MASAQPVLRTGSRGAAVTTLQHRLAGLRYDVGPIDGSFGYQTYHGVVAFQKVNGLVRDGIVGPRTWYALAHPLIPRPRRWLSVSSLEANLTRQVVYLARQGVVLRILDASSGTASTPTPTGNFTIYRRIDGWRQSPAGAAVAPELFLRRLRGARLDLGAGLPGQPRLCPGDRAGDQPAVVAAARRHAGVVYR